MIIDDKRQDNLTLDDLDSGDIKCVNLNTGEICGFLINSKVTTLIVRLVIE